jgi:FlaG/FlaF family flagellin (archaellin)
MSYQKKQVPESAVSPVVGVMLMLVVTIIIAAVVSAFSGGLTSGSKEVPQAVITADVKYNADNGMGGRATRMEFKLISGDALPTKDLAIITYFTNTSGITLKHEQTATSDAVDMYPGWSYYSRVPANFNMAKGNANAVQQHFGNFTWVTGDILSTGGDPGTASLLGMSGTWDGELIDSDLKAGSVVDVKIKHVPSGKFIFDKEVVVE